MPDLSREAGQLIEARHRALAEAVVSRQYARQPGLRERYGPGGQATPGVSAGYAIPNRAATLLERYRMPV